MPGAPAGAQTGLAFLTTPPPLRSADDPDVRVIGSRRAVQAFFDAIEPFPAGGEGAASRVAPPPVPRPHMTPEGPTQMARRTRAG